MQQINVEEKFNNKKLSDLLFSKYNGLTKNTLYKAFRKKDIRINNIRITEDKIVHSGDIITIFILDNLLYKNIKLEKIYEDNNILVVNKPLDIEVIGDNSLTNLLEKEYSFISPCHRLDRNTMGLVLFAKNEESLKILLDKFKNKEIEKHYLAKVCTPSEIKKSKNNIHKSNFNNKCINLKDGCTQKLEAYLFKDNKKSKVYISDTPKKGYVKIETSITLLERNNKQNYMILDVELHTGKTHQIRAHLAHIGLPIIGDGKYGINEINKKFGFNTQQLFSYKLKFNFITDSGILTYLNGKEIILK